MWAGLEPQPGRVSHAYISAIAGTVGLLAGHGIRTLLDMHQDLYSEGFGGDGAPNWAIDDDGLPRGPYAGFPATYFTLAGLKDTFDHFWRSDHGPDGAGLQDHLAADWAAVARHFARDPNVLGYDVLNEPYSGTTSCFLPAGCPQFEAHTLTSFYRRVARAIRRVDRRHLVWAEPEILFDIGAPLHVGNLEDRHAGLAYHNYCSSPSCGGDAGVRLHTMADNWSRLTDGALFMGEFGAGVPARALRAAVDGADNAMVGWTNWTYLNVPTRHRSGAAPVPGNIVGSATKPATGSNVNWAQVDALTEPYPQAIAGTPRRFGFDPRSRRLRLTFTTRGIGGRLLAPGTATVIWTPTLAYPTGYRISISGARVVSQAGATWTTVVACPRTKLITLEVAPAAGSGALPVQARRCV